MVKVNIGGCSSFVKDAEYKEYVEKALASFDVLEAENGAGNDFLGWKHLPSQTPESLIKACEDVRDDWKSRNVDLVIVIGIGGSYLGAKCAIEALSHSFARELHKKDAPEVVFAGNNLSEEYISELIDLMKVRNAACVVISKSGTTTEPAVAFRIVKQHLEETYGREEAAARIVAVTDAHKGALKTLSTQEGYRTFVVPDNVGGRFSVLTPVGLLPIVLAGFDIRALLEGAKEEEKALAERSEANAAVAYAAMRNLLHSVYGKSVEVLVSFTPKFQYLGEMIGFSAVIGSWNTIVTWPPRTLRMARSLSSNRFWPSSITLPSAILAWASGRIRRMVFAMVVFPAPVSPTRPRVLPRSRSKLTPLTAWTVFPPDTYSTRRSSTLRKAF